MINSRETTRETNVAPKGKGVPKLSGKRIEFGRALWRTRVCVPKKKLIKYGS